MKIVRQSKTAKSSVVIKCAYCGEEFTYYCSKKSMGTRKTCSRSCWNKYNTGKNNARWKNGYTRDDGYRVVRANGECVLEHRHFMEEHLGRKLKKGEVVHHKDGNPSNNMIENLVLFENNSVHNSTHATTYRSDTHKQCTKCMEIKPRSCFSNNRKKKLQFTDPHDTRCKNCKKISTRKRRALIKSSP